MQTFEVTYNNGEKKICKAIDYISLLNHIANEVTLSIRFINE